MSFRTPRRLATKIATSAAALAVLALPALALPPGSNEMIEQRISPVGDLRLVAEEAADATPADEAVAMAGEEVYGQYCQACHAQGVSGSPILGDESAWEPRISKGIQTLYEHTYEGINAMPARGTCMQCSDEELRNAVNYMVGEVDPSAVPADSGDGTEAGDGSGDAAAQEGEATGQ